MKPLVALTWGLELTVLAALAQPVTQAASRPADPLVSDRSGPVTWEREDRRTAVPARASGPEAPAAVTESGQPSTAAGATLSMRASWYCNANPRRGPVSRCTAGYPDGPGADLYAAVPRGMLSLRGSHVVVSAGGRSVTVQVIDCNCSGGSIDLYADAFAQLAPLSAGRIRVTVSPVLLPATDTEGDR